MTTNAHHEETIAAIATAVAAGQGGIAIIRVSGSFAQESVKEILSIPGKQIWESHKIIYGYVMDEKRERQIDEVLILIMEGPRSFTGEDVVEIHCHGGLIVVQEILERILQNPNTRRALPGEFSQRAVINGRLGITQAEALTDLVAARSNKAAEIAINGLDGGIQKKITNIRKKLLEQLSELEARIDFEDDLPELNSEHFLRDIDLICKELRDLIIDSKKAKYFKRGLQVAIIGKPNVGKSSLLNLICGYNRAIVTELPGTTRDTIESELILEGVPIRLIDTAGIRTTEDKLEQLGIELSHRTIMNSDIVILVYDLSKGWGEDEKRLLKNIPDEIPKIVVGNKLDIVSESIERIKFGYSVRKINITNFSARTGEGKEELIKKLLGSCGANDGSGLLLALNERQLDLAVIAEASLREMKKTAEQKLAFDFWTIDLRQAISSLGEITGEEINEAVLDNIFSKFCIGK